MSALKIQPISETTNYLKMLVYGPSGIGKTYLLGTACDVPELMPMLVADVEGGLATIRDREVDVVRIQTWTDILDVGNYMVKNPDVYKTLAVDSVSMLFDLCMAAVLGARTNDMPQQRDWGKAAQAFLGFIVNLTKLPCHVLATSLERDQKDEFTGAVMFNMDIPGQSQRRLPAYFDTVSRLAMAWPGGSQADPVRVLQSQPFGKYLAKDRWGLPAIMPNPTMSKIYHKENANE